MITLPCKTCRKPPTTKVEEFNIIFSCQCGESVFPTDGKNHPTWCWNQLQGTPSIAKLRNCKHHWTVTSDCPTCLKEELMDAYAEIRKQVFVSRVLYDRDLYERAELFCPGNL